MVRMSIFFVLTLFFVVSEGSTFINQSAVNESTYQESIPNRLFINDWGSLEYVLSGTSDLPENSAVGINIYDHTFTPLESLVALVDDSGDWFIDLSDKSYVTEFQLLNVEAVTLNYKTYQHRISRVLQVGDSPETLYVSPFGFSSGESIEHPAALDQITNLSNQMTNGGTIVLLGGGSYTHPMVDFNPSHDKLIVIKGESQVMIQGDRTSWVLSNDPEEVTDVSGWPIASDFGFRLKRGNVALENIICKDCGGEGVIIFDNWISTVKVVNFDAYNIRRLVTHQNSKDNVGILGLDISGTDITGFSKQAIRVRSNSGKITISDFYLDSGRQDKDNFAVGIQIGDNSSLQGVSFVNIVSGTVKNSHSTIGAYFNGDGIVSENADHNIFIDSVVSTGHTDGGVDLKSENTFIFNSEFSDNKRNIRLWGGVEYPVIIHSAIFGDTVSRGGIGATSQVALYSNKSNAYVDPKEALIYASTFAGDSNYILYADGYNVSVKSVGSDLAQSHSTIKDLYAYPKSNTSVFSLPGDVDQPYIESSRLIRQHISDFDFSLALSSDEQSTWKLLDSELEAKLAYNKLIVEAPGSVNISKFTLKATDNSGNSRVDSLSVNFIDNPYGVGSHILYQLDASSTGTKELFNGWEALYLSDPSGISLTDIETIDTHKQWSIFSRVFIEKDGSIRTIAKQGEGWSQRSYELRINSDLKLQFLYSKHSNGSYKTDLISSLAIPSGVWTEVGAIRDNAGIVHLFIDGTEVGSKSVNQVASKAPIRIMPNFNGYVNYINIKMGVSSMPSG